MIKFKSDAISFLSMIPMPTILLSDEFSLYFCWHSSVTEQSRHFPPCVPFCLHSLLYCSCAPFTCLYCRAKILNFLYFRYLCSSHFYCWKCPLIPLTSMSITFKFLLFKLSTNLVISVAFSCYFDVRTFYR